MFEASEQKNQQMDFFSEPQISARKHGGVNLNKYEHEIFLKGK